MTTAIFDADSHLMETADWLGSFADPQVRDQLLPLVLDGAGAKATELMSTLPELWEGQRHQNIGPEVLKGPKGWMAPGALDTQVRSRVLDALGISAQMVFPTFALVQFARSDDLDVLYGGTRALNRAMAAFCAPDQRLKAVGFVPLTDPQRAVMALEEAIDEGVSAVWLPSEAPGDFSPTHTDLDPVWARLAEAGVPFVLHVGGGKLLPRAFHNNGLPRPRDWLGGGENLRAKDFPVVHHSPERFLACLALDGVFERHPTLRGAAIELGATWVPGLLRNVDYAHRSFSKFEPTLKSLPL
ncbi:MAG: amidohydrolase family protein, partial [Acidimicrobiales bacterium]